MISTTTLFTEQIDVPAFVARWANTDDHAQAASGKSLSRQHIFLLGRACLRALLAQATQRKDWNIVIGINGKPHLVPPDGGAGPHISLAHTKGLIACAVSDRPVGIDVENWKARDCAALATYAFSADEAAQVARHGASAFYRLWTLKEAMAKATGKGIFDALGQRDNLGEVGISEFWTAEPWQFFYQSPAANYSLALATSGETEWTDQSIAWLELADYGP